MAPANDVAVVRVFGTNLPLRLLPHLYAVVRTCIQEDADHIEPGDALSVLSRLAGLLKLRANRVRAACNFARNGAHGQLLERVTAEAIDLRKHIVDGELDGEESDDVSASREWLEERNGPGSTLSPQDATLLHRFMTRKLTSDGYESEDEDSSYVMYEGPVYNVVHTIRFGKPKQ